MNKFIYYFVIATLFLTLYTEGVAQVAINTDGSPATANAALDLNPAIGKAFIPPKMTYAQIRAISPASEGMLVYDTEFKTLRMYNGTRWMALTQQILDVPGTFTTQGASTAVGTAAVDALGNIYVVGNFNGTINFGGLAGSLTSTSMVSNLANTYLVKYNASGIAQWARKGGFGDNESNVAGLAVDGSNNVYITGQFLTRINFDAISLYSSGFFDAFIVKYSESGTVLWATRGGGAGEDSGLAITTDASNVYVAGYLRGDVTFGTLLAVVTDGNKDAFVATFNASGVLQAVKRSSGLADESATKVTTDASGNVYIAGYFSGTAVFAATPSAISLISAGLTDAFTAKYDVSGNLVWAKRAGGSGDDTYLIQGIAADASGNAYATGYYSGTWAVTGLSGITSAGGSDAYLLKYNSVGAEQWIKSMGGAGDEYAYGIATDALGSIYVTGSFTGTGLFGTLPSITSAGGTDVYLVKYNSSGEEKWVQRGGGAGADVGRVIFVVPSGGILTQGSFVPTAQFATQTLTTGNTFVMKYME